MTQDLADPHSVALNPAASRNVMILEEEIIIALDLAGLLEDLGFVVVKMANRVDTAIDFVTAGALDLAILDMNVRDTLSFPVAAILRDRGIPFLFVSGYGKRGLIDGFEDAHVLTKPYSAETLGQMVAVAMTAAA